jgi:hypothetical protein
MLEKLHRVRGVARLADSNKIGRGSVLQSSEELRGRRQCLETYTQRIFKARQLNLRSASDGRVAKPLVPSQGKTLVMSGEKYGGVSEIQFDRLRPEIWRTFKIRKSGDHKTGTFHIWFAYSYSFS